MPLRTLSIDIETYSSADLKKSGVYKYTEAPDFEILIFAFAFDGEEVVAINLSKDPLPAEVLKALTDPAILKTAFNAAFERTCIQKHFAIRLPAEQWECTMIRAALLGLPMSLAGAAKALGLKVNKDAAGSALIRFFSIPQAPTKGNGGRTRNLPDEDLFRFADFMEYCAQDVRVEIEVRNALRFVALTDSEARLWALDQRINDTGVAVDARMVRAAINMDALYRDRMEAEMAALTGLQNANSVQKLKAWVSAETGETVDTMRKADVAELRTGTDCDTVDRVLELRQELSKTSVKKYAAIEACACADGRVRGLLQFYGAARTGRWAGRLVQMQNLPQNHIEDLDTARSLVTHNDPTALELCYGNVPDTLSQLIRTAFIAPAGSRLIVADFSAIEARVIAWLAGEQWRMEVFNSHGKIYEASAAQMFKVPIESVTKGSDLRQKGKVSELALGYAGGTNALIAMGALKMGIEEDALKDMVIRWRQANKAIVALWQCLEEAALTAVRGTPREVKGLRFYRLHETLFVRLHSGRVLAYALPALQTNRWGNESVSYMGVDGVTKQWCRQETYGGKLVENIVQAIARDCLAEALLRVDAAGYKIIMHVHDEIIVEAKDGEGSLDELCELMGAPMPWAPDLPLRADGYETPYYKKD